MNASYRFSRYKAREGLEWRFTLNFGSMHCEGPTLYKIPTRGFGMLRMTMLYALLDRIARIGLPAMAQNATTQPAVLAVLIPPQNAKLEAGPNAEALAKTEKLASLFPFEVGIAGVSGYHVRGIDQPNTFSTDYR